MSTSYYFLVPLLAALGNTVLAFIVLHRDRHNELHRAFAYATSMVVFWNLNIFVFSVSEDATTAFYWSRFFRVGTLFMPVAVAHFFFVFSEMRPTYVRRFLVLAYVVVLFLVVANAGDLLVSDLRRYQSGFYYVGTPLYRVFTLLAFLCAAVTFYLLLSEYARSPSPRKRLQARLWLLGMSVGIPFGLTNLILVPATRIPPLGNLANMVYVGVIAYGILRHRLMDVDLVVTKGIAYLAVSLALVAPMFILVVWLQRESFGTIHREFSVVVLIVLVATGLLFPSLRSRAELRIGQSLFPEKIEYRAALSAFTRSIVRILDREQLLHELAATLTQTLQPSHLAIFLRNEERRAYCLSHSVGSPAATREFSTDNDLIHSLAQRYQVVMLEELEASRNEIERMGAARSCRENEWDVCIPFGIGQKLIGFVGLGSKRNLKPYFTEDLDLLQTLAAQVAVAMENARLYEEIKRSQDIIRRVDRLSALGTLAAGIAHEIRNPLVSIQTFFQLAPQRLHDEEFITTFLNLTANEVTRISGLINELLSFARSPTRSLEMTSINSIIERVITLLEPEARKHKVALSRTLAADVPPSYADPDQMKQVLINIVLNAIQATPAGGTVSVASRSVRKDGVSFGQVEIRDTGIGIPGERLNHIFDPFFTTKDKGTGLGLAIVHRIVTEHGGFIRVESKEGKGTCFLVDLPASELSTARDYPAKASEARSHEHTDLRKVAS